MHLKKRTGKCLDDCDACCKGCPYLDPNTKKCLAYHDRPRWCHKDFPLDNFDIWSRGLKGICGYKFKKK